MAVSFSLVSTGTLATAAVRGGAACTKAGATTIVSGKKFTCIKSAGKLIGTRVSSF